MIKISYIQVKSAKIKTRHSFERLYGTFNGVISDYLTIVKNDEELTSLTLLIQEFENGILLQQAIIVNGIAVPIE